MGRERVRFPTLSYPTFSTSIVLLMIRFDSTRLDSRLRAREKQSKGESKRDGWIDRSIVKNDRREAGNAIGEENSLSSFPRENSRLSEFFEAAARGRACISVFDIFHFDRETRAGISDISGGGLNTGWKRRGDLSTLLRETSVLPRHEPYTSRDAYAAATTHFSRLHFRSVIYGLSGIVGSSNWFLVYLVFRAYPSRGSRGAITSRVAFLVEIGRKDSFIGGNFFRT